MEGCSKTGADAVSDLPNAPLVDILSRVPAKSICRFKSVSEAWRDLIADPDHRKKLRQAMQGFFVQRCEVPEVDGVEPGADGVEPEVDGVEPASINFNFIDLTVGAEPTGIKTFVVLDSCNGLILFGHNREPAHPLAGSYIVCNPTTKQWSAVPACGSPEAVSHTYLAFDLAVSSHFHLVQFQMPEVDTEIESLHVYSSETGTWSQNQIDDDEQKEQGQLEGWHHQFKLEALDYHCAFVDGFLHLIVWGADRQHILVVDVQGKARKIIAVPGMADGSQMDNITSYLGQSQGQLHCLTIESADENNDKLSTWVLQDYDTQEWLLKSTVNSLDLYGETEVRPEYQVVDIHQDRNVLYFLNQLTFELIEYMDCKEVSLFATFNDFKFRGDFTRYIPCFLESPVLTNKN